MEREERTKIRMEGRFEREKRRVFLMVGRENALSL